ncbi:hypothetical protein BGW36DRAFT_286384 [Talaromyces proteolyticus]|uniref:Uncharacterized protein n=1 Tax=Talaromyces proteolyticus TaxID=1131652 RepID=A0AAD4L1W5_9EURO|nr:uncharacterized protein BGW36DRAFT_286384 [Talaromyces proteolyticus]KAH8705090.1 hypothetical protein BGW36DRAFT_286384 [Talaromyces proteolyticus]
MFLVQNLDQSASSGVDMLPKPLCNMMVPRAFLFSSAPFQRASAQYEKPSKTQAARPRHDKSRSPPLPRDATLAQPVTVAPSDIPHTNPVVIPPQQNSNRNDAHYSNARPAQLGRNRAASTQTSSSQPSDTNLSPSLATLLQTTTIPRRARSIRSPRRLPPGNHVEDFSRLLREGVKSRGDASILDGSGSSPLDCLLSPPDDEYDKSESVSTTELQRPDSIRSISSDSMPSLDHELNSLMTSGPITPSSSVYRRSRERRKQFSPPQDCASNHPLLESDLDSLDTCFESLESLEPPSVPSHQSTSLRTFPRLGSTFKSNLTASLRAIKSAAQTVSNFATPSVQPDDFLTRSLFSIAPELTDDRRPLPTNEPPSPALRRYLNPITLSPSEMYVYNEFRQDVKGNVNNTPASIQMQTYHRSGPSSKRGRFSAGRDNDQQAFTFDPEVPSSRQREPRENSDFLRMVVLEMNMRRKGKLRDDIPTRAKIWLPPRKAIQFVSEVYSYDEPAVPQRWMGISIERTQG